MFMKVRFLGTGEAYSEDRNNTSILIKGKENLLLDCGFTTPYSLGKYNKDKDFIDYVFISHFHGDHVAGLPLLCMKWRQEKRTKSLIILGPTGIKEYFYQLFEMLYKGFSGKSTFPIEIMEVQPNQKIDLGNFNLEFAKGYHLTGETNVEAIAIRVVHDNKTVCYSGDTIYSQDIERLAKNCDLLIHEAYMPAESTYHAMKAHCSPLETGKLAKAANVKLLALVHLHRNYSEKTKEMISEASKEFNGEIIIPKDGDEQVL